MLKQMLSEDIIDGEEAYELSWVEKKHRLLKLISLLGKR